MARKVDCWKIPYSRKASTTLRIVEDLFNPENAALKDTLAEACGVESPKILLIADANVVQVIKGIGSDIGRYVKAHGLELACPPLLLPGGEKIKADNFQSVLKVINTVIAAKIGIHDAVVVLGGGSLMDVVGYSVSQTRGGLPQIRIPTSVGAAIGAAVSQMARLNIGNLKDSISAPSIPATVLVDPRLALSVPNDVWVSGISELIRLAVAFDAPLMKKIIDGMDGLCARDEAVVSEILYDAMKIRAKNGSSPIGLWSAMRLEAMGGYKLPHGYAKSMALILDCAYSNAKSMLSNEDYSAIHGAMKVCGALASIAMPPYLLAQPENIAHGMDIWRLATGDSKVLIPCKIGECVEVEDIELETFKVVTRQFLPVATEKQS